MGHCVRQVGDMPPSDRKAGGHMFRVQETLAVRIVHRPALVQNTNATRHSPNQITGLIDDEHDQLPGPAGFAVEGADIMAR